MVADELGIADLVLEYKTRGKRSHRSLVASRSRRRSLMAPGYAWSAAILFECPVCGATAEKMATKCRDEKLMEKEFRPLCHNNRNHGLMEVTGSREQLVMCSWA